MRSPQSSDNSCRTAAAGFPHLPLQVACLEVVEVPLPAAGLYLVSAPADVFACRSSRRAAGPPHKPLQATCRVVVDSGCLEVVEVPLPAAGFYRVSAPADVSACRSPRRAAGPPHQPLQAACLVVVEVPQPLPVWGGSADRQTADALRRGLRSTSCFYR